MTTPINFNSTAAACRAFLMQMRREHVSRHGIEAEVKVPVFDELESDNRGVLMRSMRIALEAAKKSAFNKDTV